MKDKYTNEDKICPHCGGKLEWHSDGFSEIKWCDDCGSNNPKSPPKITVEFTK